MGFDTECILNIQSLPGEYFCPVCRTLVYPNEALQSQCTHLYCKPCLAYVVATTQACPYDGYLVTEADSKPLLESNKALAEAIGKVTVYCLYHRSGCQWQGTLSDCATHTVSCGFGNSPVVCNRCGTQILHREVQEHAQACPGVQGPTQPADALQAQPAAAAVQATSQGQPVAAATAATALAPSSIPASAGAAAVAAAAPTAAAPAAPAVAGKAQGQPNAAGQPQAAVAPQAPPAADQWYQQHIQYQQYYQQYPGYNPYVQYQQYGQQYPQGFQQYPPTQVQGAPQGAVQPRPQMQQPAPVAQPVAPAQPPQVAAVQMQPLQQQQTFAQAPPPLQQPLPNAQPVAYPTVNAQMGMTQAPHHQQQTQYQPPSHHQPFPNLQHPPQQPPNMQPAPSQLPAGQALMPPQAMNLQPHPQVQSYPQPQPLPHAQTQMVPNAPPQNAAAAHAVTGHQSYPQLPPQVQPSSVPHQRPGYMPPQQSGMPYHQPPIMRPSGPLQGQFPIQGQQSAGTFQQGHLNPQLPQQQPQQPGFPPQSHQQGFPPQHLQQGQPYQQGGPVSQPSMPNQQPMRTQGPPYMQQQVPGQGLVHNQPPVGAGRSFGPGTPAQQFQNTAAGAVNQSHPGGIVQQPAMSRSSHMTAENIAVKAESVGNAVESGLDGAVDDGKKTDAQKGLDEKATGEIREKEVLTNDEADQKADGKSTGSDNAGTQIKSTQVKDLSKEDGLHASKDKVAEQDSKAADSKTNGISAPHSTDGDARGPLYQKTTIPQAPQSVGSHMINVTVQAGPHITHQGPRGQPDAFQRPPGPDWLPPFDTPHSTLPPDRRFPEPAMQHMQGARPEMFMGPMRPPAYNSAEIFQPPHSTLSDPFRPPAPQNFGQSGHFGQPHGQVQSHVPMPHSSGARAHADSMFRPAFGGPSETFDGRQSDPPFVQSGNMSVNGPPGRGPVSGGMSLHGELMPAIDGHGRPYSGFHGAHNAGNRELEDDLKKYQRPAHSDAEGLPWRPTESGHGHFGQDGFQRPFDKVSGPDGFPDSKPGRGLYPYQLGGPFPPGAPSEPNNVKFGERHIAGGFHEEFGRNNNTIAGRRDMFNPDPEFGRYRMDGMPPRSPGREFGGFQAGFRKEDASGFAGAKRKNLDGPPGPHDHFAPRPFGGDMNFGGSFPRHGFINEPGRFGSGPYHGEVDLFEHPRSRTSTGIGWCRICRIDCETVEGLDHHSQTREHQKIAMDMVLSIKHEAAKRQKLNPEGVISLGEKKPGAKGGSMGRGNRRVN